MSIKISDVAKAAGVSTATVSRIINEQPGYSEETKQKVLRVIEELGYRPNAFAQGLMSKRSRTIGILIPEVSSRFSAELLRGIEKVGHERGYSSIVCNTDRNGERTMEYFRILSEKQVDGIVFTSEWLKDEYARYVEKMEIPMALVATYSHAYSFPSVRVDDRVASYSAVRYLVEQGHRSIGMISGTAEDPIAGQPRIEGYRQALSEAGLTADEAKIVYGDFHFRSGVRAMQELYQRQTGITALFAASDEMALGAMALLHSRQVRVPEELSIIGYDDTLDAEMSYPALTTVHQPVEEMGEVVMELLLNGEQGEERVLQHSITERDSVVTRSLA